MYEQQFTMDQQFTIFVASSVAGIEIARAIQTEFMHDYSVKIWSQGVFLPSEATIDSLLKASMNYDFGIFVFSPDDTQVKKDGEKVLVARDNVLFECGLFFSTIGRRSCFFMVPKNIENFRIPSDLWGITPVAYDCGGDIKSKVGVACNQIRDAIRDLTQERSKGLSYNGEWTLEWFVEESKRYKSAHKSKTYVRHIGNRFVAICNEPTIPFEIRGEIKNGRYITGTWSQSEANYFGAFQLVASPSGNSMKGLSVGFKSNNEVLSGNWLLTRITDDT